MAVMIPLIPISLVWVVLATYLRCW